MPTSAQPLPSRQLLQEPAVRNRTSAALTPDPDPDLQPSHPAACNVPSLLPTSRPPAPVSSGWSPPGRPTGACCTSGGAWKSKGQGRWTRMPHTRAPSMPAASGAPSPAARSCVTAPPPGGARRRGTGRGWPPQPPRLRSPRSWQRRVRGVSAKARVGRTRP